MFHVQFSEITVMTSFIHLVARTICVCKGNKAETRARFSYFKLTSLSSLTILVRDYCCGLFQLSMDILFVPIC